jgi:hypothetical protein
MKNLYCKTASKLSPIAILSLATANDPIDIIHLYQDLSEVSVERKQQIEWIFIKFRNIGFPKFRIFFVNIF